MEDMPYFEIGVLAICKFVISGLDPEIAAVPPTRIVAARELLADDGLGASPQRGLAAESLTSDRSSGYILGFIPPVRLGGRDAGPPSGGPCAFRGYYQPLGLWKVPSRSLRVAGNWLAARAAGRIGL